MNSKNSAEIQVYSYSKHKLKRRISPSHADATEILRFALNDIFITPSAPSANSPNKAFPWHG